MDRIARVAFDTPDYHGMLAMRRRLLRTPLGLEFTDAELATEPTQIHLALWRDDAVVGTLLLVPPDAGGTARLRQMAVEPRFQRQGCGASLVSFAERELGRLGTSLIVLAARGPAVPFYERLGYGVRGAPYVELTIPHVRMEKSLPERGFAS